MTDIASLGTAAGALFIAGQLGFMYRQSTTKFEDSFTREYRKIIRKIPVNAMLDKNLSPDEQEAHLTDFYFYFDLCNEQKFYHDKKRIREETWTFWCDGMKSNFARPAFKSAWKEVCKRAGKDFKELRDLFPPD